MLEKIESKITDNNLMMNRQQQQIPTRDSRLESNIENIREMPIKSKSKARKNNGNTNDTNQENNCTCRVF